MADPSPQASKMLFLRVALLALVCVVSIHLVYQVLAEPHRGINKHASCEPCMLPHGNTSSGDITVNRSSGVATQQDRLTTDEPPSETCTRPPLTRHAARGYSWHALDDYLNTTELLYSGIGPGTKYSHHRDARRDIVELGKGFVTTAMSERFALSRTTNSSKLCLVKAWLDDWHAKTDGRFSTVLHEELLAQVATPSFWHPQGYYYAAGDASGKLLYERYRGFDPDRPMAIRSQSKALTAAVILGLQDRGLLSIDDAVAKYLPSFRGNATLERITLRMVLAHTSGAHRYTGDGKPASTDPPSIRLPNITLADSAALMLLEGLRYEPGTTMWYTCTAYQALGAVAEVVTGKSWHAVFRDVIGEPLGLQDTEWFNYWSGESGVSNPLLAVGAASSPRDYTRFVTMLMQNGTVVGGDGRKVRVLSEAAVVDMFTVQRNTTGLITKAFATQNARALEQLHAMKLASDFTTELAVATWPKSLGYGLGCWLAVDGTSGRKIIRLVGMFNTHVTIWDWETGRPHFAMGMAFSKFDGGWEMANTVFYREVKGIGDPPPPPPLRAKVGRSKG